MRHNTTAYLPINANRFTLSALKTAMLGVFVASASVYGLSAWANEPINLALANQPNNKQATTADNDNHTATNVVANSSNLPVSQTDTKKTTTESSILNALHIKKAIEQGELADVPENLEKLNINKNINTNNKVAGVAIPKDNHQADVLESEQENIQENPQENVQETNANNEQNTQSLTQNDALIQNDKFDENFTLDNQEYQENLAKTLQKQAKEVQNEQYKMETPKQIETYLQDVEKNLQQQANFNEPVASLDEPANPLGLDKNMVETPLPQPNNLDTLGKGNEKDNEKDDEDKTLASKPNEIQTNSQVLSPNNYLPDYEALDTKDDDKKANKKVEKKKQKHGNFIKRLYNRFFNDGYEALPNIKTTVYMIRGDEEKQAELLEKSLSEDGSTIIDKSNLKKASQDNTVANNIKAVLDSFSVDSISNFSAVLPRLRQEALNAAKAVGYYDVKLRFYKRGDDRVDVIIESMGKPILVNSRVVDIRGQGADMPEFQHLKDVLPPLKGDVLNQGEYENSKFVIESLSSRYGFFDANWLNKSVDIILPDNTADIDLIYDTGTRYHFGDVVFFTLDKETNQLTTDPNKLPIKPEILNSLLEFKSGEPFYRPSVTQLTNNLSATRYFNTLNVSMVTPPEQAGAGTLSFENSDETAPTEVSGQDDIFDGLFATDEQTDKTTENKKEDNKEDKKAAQSTDEDKDNLKSEQSTNGEQPEDEQIQEEFVPIDFSINEQTHEKLVAIKEKADRLVSLPDDRVLDEKKEKSKNLLGKISDAVSHIASKILPDEEDTLATGEPQTLAERKTPEEVEHDKKVPVYVFVLADKPKEAQFGLGYGSDTGGRVTARFDNNLLNKKGTQVGVEVLASRANQNLTLYATTPYKHPLNDTLNASLSYEQKSDNDVQGNFGLRTRTIKASVGRNITKESGWSRHYYLDYRLDELRTAVDKQVQADLPVRFTSSKPKQTALLLGYAMSKTNVDNPTQPMQGTRQQYSLQLGSKSALSDANMAILQANIGGIYSFGKWNKNQVIGRLNLGYLWADDFYDVPYQLRFFAGGDQSIRGYDYNSLSPMNSKGYLTGGQALAVGNVEYNYEFKKGWRGAVFTDVGSAYNKEFSNPTKVGVGVGVRWASPVGTVRMDLATGITEKDKPVRLYFLIGSPLW